jgi:hypothetical protein
MRPVSTGANLIAGSATSLITRTAPAAAQPAARPPSAQGGTAAGTLSAPVKLPPVRPTAPRVPVKPPVRPPSGEAAGLLRLGVAAGLGAWIGWNLPDWIDKIVNRNKTIEVEGRCEVKDYADSFLKNLRNEGKDVAMRSLPPTEYSWKLPNGYAFAVRQQASKYGLEIGGELKTPDGKSYPFKLNATGGSTRVFDTDWIAGNERFGQLAIDVRTGATGVNEVLPSMAMSRPSSSSPTVAISTRRSRAWRASTRVSPPKRGGWHIGTWWPWRGSTGATSRRGCLTC